MMTLPLALAAALSLLAAPPTRPDPPPAERSTPEPEARAMSRVTLQDGQVLRGFVVSRDAEHVVLELAAGGRLELSASVVETIEEESEARLRPDGEVWLPDPNRTRYLYAPSGMMLRQGEGYFSQKELFFTSMNYGVTDHLTLQAGAVLPAWLIQNGINFIGGLKVGGSLSDTVHLAAGAQALFLPGLMDSGAVTGFVFGTATYGTPDAHLSLAAGVPFSLYARGWDVVGNAPLFTLSGNLRVGRQFALVSENWLLPALAQDVSLPMINSLAGRIFGESWAVDIGLIRIPELSIPVPWLDFSWNFH